MITTESLLANNSANDLNSRYSGCYLLTYYKEHRGVLLVGSIYNTDSNEDYFTDNAVFISGEFLYIEEGSHNNLIAHSIQCDIASLILTYNTPALGVINTPKGAVWVSKIVKRQWKRGLSIGNITSYTYTDNFSVGNSTLAYSILTNEYISIFDGIVSILSNHTDSVGINNVIALVILPGRGYISVFYRDIEVGYIHLQEVSLVLHSNFSILADEIREMGIGITIGVVGNGY